LQTQIRGELEILIDIIGTIGVGLIIVSYMLLQLGKLKSVDLIYSIANLLGSLLIIFSLTFKFNFAAFIVEAFWVLISVYGIYKFIRNKKG